MRRTLLILFLILFFISDVFALDCQYRVNETYSVEEEWFYFNDKFEGINLNMNELVRVENSHLSFFVYNNLTIPVTVKLDYKVVSTWFGLNYPTSAEVEVGPIDSKRYDDSQINTQLNSYIGITDFDYTIINPKVSSEYKNVEKQREICKNCSNGKQCLDDNSPCSLDSKCGSGICNIVGFCGNERIVACEPYGKLNCKNQTCLIPSIKKVGDVYMCEWECKSGYGKDNVCIKNPKTTRNLTPIFLAFLILIGGIGAILIKRAKGNEIAKKIIKNAKKKEKEILSKAENRARGIISKAEEKLGKIDIDLEDKRLQKEELERDLESLNKDAKSVKAIKAEILKTTEEIKGINKKKQEEINKLIKTYKERYGPEFILDNGYIRFAKSWLNPSEKGDYFHIWLFENHHKLKVKPSYEIHHKDFNKLNNDIANLQEVTKEEHKEKHINRYR